MEGGVRLAEIEVYCFENKDGSEDTYTTTNPAEAKVRAMKYAQKVIARKYEYSDSELVWDFTGLDDPDPQEYDVHCSAWINAEADIRGIEASSIEEAAEVAVKMVREGEILDWFDFEYCDKDAVRAEAVYQSDNPNKPVWSNDGPYDEDDRTRCARVEKALRWFKDQADDDDCINTLIDDIEEALGLKGKEAS
jgi:hypothetical protein